MPSATSPWVIRFGRRDADLKLLCFAHAGGGASVFNKWAAFLPPSIEVCAVQLPGRESRFSEPALQSLDVLVDALVEETRFLRTEKFALFGHSIGALIAFEFARALRRRGENVPETMLVSAFRAPQQPSPEPSPLGLSDSEFLAFVERYGGIPQALLGLRDAMQVFLPTLRADFSLVDRYVCKDDRPFEFPLIAFGGKSDEQVTAESLVEWQAHAAGRFTLHHCTGAHFFFQSHPHEFFELLSKELCTALGDERVLRELDPEKTRSTRGFA
jgi:medium-chain acyl-[acyl-carrier-protein] hydrolase